MCVIDPHRSPKGRYFAWNNPFIYDFLDLPSFCLSKPSIFYNPPSSLLFAGWDAARSMSHWTKPINSLGFLSWILFFLTILTYVCMHVHVFVSMNTETVAFTVISQSPRHCLPHSKCWINIFWMNKCRDNVRGPRALLLQILEKRGWERLQLISHHPWWEVLD